VTYQYRARATTDNMRTDRTDPDVVLSLAAARQLSRRPELGDRNERSVFSAISQLLEALGLTLARDGSSVPEPVRDATLRLARRLLRITAQSPARADSRADSDAALSKSGKNRRIPVIPSIALGRMG
jgi:hypothetical protein